jgi:predicted acylesterase/phospholipase RssA
MIAACAAVGILVSVDEFVLRRARLRIPDSLRLREAPGMIVTPRPRPRRDAMAAEDVEADRSLGAPNGSSPFQILSLDGGGLKGLFIAAALAEIEADLQTSIVDHFDLIAGTSTGGLIALGLGAGLTPAQIVDFYVREGPRIFGSGRWFRRLWRPKHDAAGLRDALTSVFGDKLLGSSAKRLVIPSYTLDSNEVYLFKTPHHPRLVRDWKERMVDVALATTAAPTYLPVARLRNNRLIDGGIWANNPALVALGEAKSILNVALEDIRILSMGTTDEVSNLGPKLDRGGLILVGQARSRSASPCPGRRQLPHRRTPRWARPRGTHRPLCPGSWSVQTGPDRRESHPRARRGRIPEKLAQREALHWSRRRGVHPLLHHVEARIADTLPDLLAGKVVDYEQWILGWISQGVVGARQELGAWRASLSGHRGCSEPRSCACTLHARVCPEGCARSVMRERTTGAKRSHW